MPVFAARPFKFIPTIHTLMTDFIARPATFVRPARFCVAAIVCTLFAAPAFAADAPAATDPAIAALVSGISAQRLGANVKTLAAFGTRHTLSVTDDPKRGIGAARRWIHDTLDKCAAESEGRLRVTYDEFTPPVSPRMLQPVPVVNVVATLEGTDPVARKRTLVVSGHYDSMCGNVMNGQCDAPGANDDASGTALVIELACNFARQRFPASIVFLTVAGEEQGLLGSEHWAKEARARDANIEAMFTNDIVGNAHDVNGKRDASYVRLFAQGVPAEATSSPESLRRLESSAENDSPPRELARTIREAAARYVPEIDVKVIYRRDRYLRGGDHIPFLAQGFTAVRFTEAHEDFRHQHQDVRVVDGVQYGDLTEFVDADYLASVTRVNAAALATLARAPAAPTGVRHRDAATRASDDARLAAKSRSRCCRVRDRLARYHGAVLAGRVVCGQRNAGKRAVVEGRLSFFRAGRQQRWAPQPCNVSDTGPHTATDTAAEIG